MRQARRATGPWPCSAGDGSGVADTLVRQPPGITAGRSGRPTAHGRGRASERKQERECARQRASEEGETTNKETRSRERSKKEKAQAVIKVQGRPEASSVGPPRDPRAVEPRRRRDPAHLIDRADPPLLEPGRQAVVVIDAPARAKGETAGRAAEARRARHTAGALLDEQAPAAGGDAVS